MNVCYLGLGSNQKSPERQISLALRSLKNIPSTVLLKVSSKYWTKVWGGIPQQDFCNVVLEIATFLPPKILLDYCQAIEKKQGRVRIKHWGPRTLDIDILWYEGRTINTSALCIPHPYMLTRDFVMRPLLEINPNIELTLNE